MNYNIYHNIGEYIESYGKSVDYLLAIFNGNDFKFAMENWIKPKISLDWKINRKQMKYCCRYTKSSYNSGIAEGINNFFDSTYFINYTSAYNYMKKQHTLCLLDELWDRHDEIIYENYLSEKINEGIAKYMPGEYDTSVYDGEYDENLQNLGRFLRYNNIDYYDNDNYNRRFSVYLFDNNAEINFDGYEQKTLYSWIIEEIS